MRRFLNWATFVVVLAAVWFLAGPTTLGGPASYVVVDGHSMDPTYHDGDLVIAHVRDSYEVGDVIVYDAPIESQFNVIHRIVAPTDGGFVTQGDNRDEPDGWIAPNGAIYGSAWFVIPQGGAAVRILRQPSIVAGLAAGLVTLEMLRHQERKRRRATRAPDTAQVSA